MSSNRECQTVTSEWNTLEDTNWSAITVLVSWLALKTFYLFASLRTYMWVPLLAALRKQLRPQQEFLGKTQESPEGVTSLSVLVSKLHLCLSILSPPFFFVPLFLTWQIRVVLVLTVYGKRWGTKLKLGAMSFAVDLNYPDSLQFKYTHYKIICTK